MKIICKSILLPPLGTRVTARIPSDDLDFGFAMFGYADGSSAVRIDWGDGIVESVASPATSAAHTYAAPGEYRIRISDDIQTLRVTTPQQSQMQSKVIGIASDAAKLNELLATCVMNCANLAEADFRQSGVTRLGGRCFGGCAALTGEVYFPNVVSYTNNPFGDCTGLRTIHFAKKNEAMITMLPEYIADPTLGSGTAVCVFDL